MDFTTAIILFFTIITSVSLTQWYTLRNQVLLLTAELGPIKDKNAALEIKNADLQQKYMDAQTHIEKHISNKAIRAKYVFDKTTGLSNSIGDDHLFCTSCLNQQIPVESQVVWTNTGWTCTNKRCSQFYPSPSMPSAVNIDY